MTFGRINKFYKVDKSQQLMYHYICLSLANPCGVAHVAFIIKKQINKICYFDTINRNLRYHTENSFAQTCFLKLSNALLVPYQLFIWENLSLLEDLEDKIGKY